ncbi:MAG: FtsX-like permease family protein, partial [Chitinispirillaceae bacterium]|nr:FtsX-like permease family protein [Chitinispirillaceae bacterium]
NADDFKIIGLLNTTDPAINNSGIFISVKDAESLLELEDLKTEVYVSMEREVNIEDFLRSTKMLQKEIEKKFPYLLAQNFFEQQADFFEISKSKRGFGIVFLLVILLIAGVGIVNTVLMSIYERIREIGLLRALGLKNKQLIYLFMLEGFYTGVLGAFLGVTIGIVLNIYLVKYGYPFDKIAGKSMGNLPIWGTIYGEWNVGTWIIVALLATVAATIAAYIPARKAGKMEVVSAMRFY